ncbi:response regulator [Pseudomonas mangiferae]|uniref:Response regulator n=1 Tax=Pseudomonas mangiferae TaxID=2593654 RepID=A0A553GXP3_9PSED|nr:response regulator [Pseudomonas mangiferae]TRX74240.1 response regulator [Pseudomonas mangiferae]
MIPLLVCDDSNMARKQLIRALPADWPVSISQAANGQEALAAIRQGLGQVMLLDLTMPVMDGYQTLAALREEGLQSRVVVVSGDVQEEAVRRVKELGALAFLKKPADPEALRATLAELGLLDLAPAAPADAPPAANPQQAVLDSLKVNFRDALREVTNVAMGRAAALLAKVLGVFVQLPVPQVNLFEVSELHMALNDAQRGQRLSAACQGFIGDGIAGEALLLFHDAEVSDVARLLKWQPRDDSETSEMLLDLASILIGACLSGIAEQIDVRFSQGHPMLLGQHASIERLIHLNQKRWKKTLAVEISYSLEGDHIHFDLLLLFTEDSVRRLTHKINYLMS